MEAELGFVGDDLSADLVAGVFADDGRLGVLAARLVGLVGVFVVVDAGSFLALLGRPLVSLVVLAAGVDGVVLVLDLADGFLVGDDAFEDDDAAVAAAAAAPVATTAAAPTAMAAAGSAAAASG